MKNLFYIIVSASLISGCANSSSAREGFYRSVVWNPLILAKENCPSLAGVYVGDERLLQDVFQELVISRKSLDPRAVVTYKQRLPVPWNPDGDPHAGEKKTKEVLERIGKARRKYDQDIESFYKSASIQIEQSSSLLTLTTVFNGVVYEKREFDLQQPGVGCYGGVLHIRYLSASGGGPEARGGSAYASEKRIKKLPSGEIQVDKNTRSWEFSDWTGVGKQYPSKSFLMTFKLYGTTIQ